MTLFGITFASWSNGWWFLAYLLFVSIFIYAYYVRSGIIKQLVAPAHRAFLLKGMSNVRRMLKLLLSLIGTLFFFIALLQPQWDEKEELIEQEGRDVLIALDVSRSMLAQDMAPTRLEFAKQKIKKLVSRLDSERVGLILFAGDAFVYCPLTHDKHAFSSFLDQVDVQTISSGTTALDKAVSKAITVYENIPTRKHRLLVTFTDGEDFSSNLGSIKQRARKVGMHVFAVGVGTAEGAPVPIVDREGAITGHEKQSDGTIVMSRLNEGILQALATDIGGNYVRATEQNDADMLTIVEQVGQFEKEAFDQAHVTSLQEKYPYFVVISFMCFLLEWLL